MIVFTIDSLLLMMVNNKSFSCIDECLFKKTWKLFNSELFLIPDTPHSSLDALPLRMLRRVSHGAEDKLYGSLQAQGAVCCLASRSGGRQEKGTMVVF